MIDSALIGIIASSGGITAAPPGGAPYSLATTDGLVAWHIAGTGINDPLAMSAWTDQSGNGNTITLASGTGGVISTSADINNRSLLTLNTSGRYAFTNSMTSADWTFLCVVSGSTNKFIYSSSSGAQFFSHRSGGGSTLYGIRYDDGTLDQTRLQSVANADEWFIVALRATGTATTYYLDGSSIGTATHSGTVTLNNFGRLGTATIIGGFSVASSIIWNTDIGESALLTEIGTLQTYYGI